MGGPGVWGSRFGGRRFRGVPGFWGCRVGSVPGLRGPQILGVPGVWGCRVGGSLGFGGSQGLGVSGLGVPSFGEGGWNLGVLGWSVPGFWDPQGLGVPWVGVSLGFGGPSFGVPVFWGVLGSGNPRFGGSLGFGVARVCGVPCLGGIQRLRVPGVWGFLGVVVLGWEVSQVWG